MSPRTRNDSAANIEFVASNWILRRDAGLTPEEEAEFQRWQTENPRHADAVARKEKAWSALERPFNAGQADWLIERLVARAASRRRRRIGRAAAGIAVLCIAATTFVKLPRGSAPAVADARAVVVLPESRTLPDGSMVELRPGAEVKIDFGGKLRRVDVKKGEAYFRVARNPERPFVVGAGKVDIRAIGTAFSVGLDSEQVDVLVTEGIVAVEKPQEEPPARDVSVQRESASPYNIATVGAGSRLAVELVAQPISDPRVPTAVSADEMSERLAWRAPKLEFSEVPLSQAVGLINRYNKVQFMIEDAALSRLQISGFFRADNFETFVRLLEGTCGIEARRAGDTIRLRKAAR